MDSPSQPNQQEEFKTIPPLGAPSPLSQVRDLSKGLGSVSWHRAVLDEAHVIKGHKQATAQAAEGESSPTEVLQSLGD